MQSRKIRELTIERDRAQEEVRGLRADLQEIGRKREEDTIWANTEILRLRESLRLCIDQMESLIAEVNEMRPSIGWEPNELDEAFDTANQRALESARVALENQASRCK
jgi:uncharacterized protein YPO0396